MGSKSKNELEKFIGLKFGRLTVKEFTGQSTIGKQKRRIVKCICDCGNEKLIPLTYLRRGHTNSCGCLLRENSTNNLKFAHQKLIKDGIWEPDPRIASAKNVWRFYADDNLSFEDFLLLSQQECFYCGALPSNSRTTACNRSTEFKQKNGTFVYSGLDRVDNNLKHSKENVVPCCYNCNIAKLDRTQSDFFSWIEDIYKKHF